MESIVGFCQGWTSCSAVTVERRVGDSAGLITVNTVDSVVPADDSETYTRESSLNAARESGGRGSWC